MPLLVPITRTAADSLGQVNVENEWGTGVASPSRACIPQDCDGIPSYPYIQQRFVAFQVFISDTVECR